MLIIGAACSGGEDDDEFPFPELTPFPDDLTAQVHGIRDGVSQLRGLAPYEEVDEGTITRETLAAYYDSAFEDLDEEEAADLEAASVVLKLLGVVEDDVDLRQIFSQEFTGVIAGLYIIEEDRLVLISAADGDLGVQDQNTIAHEYVHSFQDGKWDIEEFGEEYGGSDLEEDGYTQYSATLSCLIEGDASLADETYAEQVFGPTWREQIAAETPPEMFDDIDIPPFLGRSFSFNYNECPEFVRSLHAEGGWAAVDAAYEDPPDTTEQVMHPEKYHARELANTGPPVDLTEQLEDWRLLDSSQFGEFDVYNYAVTLTGDESAARTAAAGWGSGWARSYRNEADASRAVVQLSLGWDTRQDLIEFATVYDFMLGGLGAEAEVVSEGNVRWTAPGQYGVLFLDDQLERIEIRVATDEEALKAATADLPQFNQ
jgi:hypothetical protein